MRYWWVNQNQTFEHEVRGGYLWSPKRKANGDRNPFYDFMRGVAPGDVVFSFAGTRIRAIGIACSHAYEAPKPLEFGQTGAYWDQIGWRVDVRFIPLTSPIRPADHMYLLRPLLPDKYSPLRPGGGGLQSVYLTAIPPSLAGALLDLCGPEARGLVDRHAVAERPLALAAVGLAEWEEHEMARVRGDGGLNETTRAAVVLARRGQGLFKERVMRLESSCRITHVERVEHLRASHLKPWRDSTNEERLDGENGLLLTPTVDHLLDRGFIGFEDNGDLIVSPVADPISLRRMGVDPSQRINVGHFSSGQQHYLEYHRDSVLLRSSYMSEA